MKWGGSEGLAQPAPSQLLHTLGWLSAGGLFSPPPDTSGSGNVVLKSLSCLGTQPARGSQKQMYSFQSSSATAFTWHCA